MHTFMLICLIYSVHSLSVFSFEKSRSSENISYVSLDRWDGDILPSWFIICSSHQVGRFDNMAPYHIYGANGAPWFSFILSQDIDVFYVWGYFGENHTMLLGLIDEEPRLYFWYHICFEMDTKLSLISTAINGEMIANMSHPMLGYNVAPSLEGYISLGKWKNPNRQNEEQFHWTISNIQVYAGGLDIMKLSAFPCSSKGDILTWETMTWTVVGDGVSRQDKDPETVCSKTNQRNLAIPVNMNRKNAMNICRKLGRSYMTAALNLEHLAAFTIEFSEKTGGACTYIWTPYSDWSQEGVFINLEDKTPLNYSAWYEGQPNGFRLEDAIQIKLNVKDVKKSYWDKWQNREACFSCSSTRLLILHLLGVCQWTLLDFQYFPIEDKKGGIVFIGLQSSEIR